MPRYTMIKRKAERALSFLCEEDSKKAAWGTTVHQLLEDMNWLQFLFAQEKLDQFTWMLMEKVNRQLAEMCRALEPEI